MSVALVIGCAVCTHCRPPAPSSTDLKVGYWLGASPYQQQRWKFLGILVASLCVGAVIWVLATSYGFLIQDASGQTVVNPDLPAPQGNLMATIVSSVMGGEQQALILFVLGGIVAVMLEMRGSRRSPSASACTCRSRSTWRSSSVPRQATSSAARARPRRSARPARAGHAHRLGSDGGRGDRGHDRRDPAAAPAPRADAGTSTSSRLRTGSRRLRHLVPGDRRPAGERGRPARAWSRCATCSRARARGGRGRSERRPTAAGSTKRRVRHMLRGAASPAVVRPPGTA